MTILKLLILWLLISTVTLIAGWFLMLHGGVNFESAARSGESVLLYDIEMILSQILMWPLSSIVWVWDLLSPSNKGRMVSEYLFLVSHYAGYGLALIIYRYCSAKWGKLIKDKNNEKAAT